MATSILPQPKTPLSSRSLETAQTYLEALKQEREEMVALVIVLLNRLEEKESEQDFASTDLILMRMLDEKVCSTKHLQSLERVLTGVPA